MAEVILIYMCVKIGSLYRKTGEHGAGKYIWGVWLTWLAGIIIAGIIGASGGGMGGLFFVLLLYIVLFSIAASGIRSGKQYTEAYAAMQKREDEKRMQEMTAKAVADALAKEHAAHPAQ
jgi:uncharacterized membrane protein